MDINKWLDYVKEAGVIVDNSHSECDICEADSRRDSWMRKEILEKYGDEAKPHVCQKHGQQYGLAW